MAEAFVYLWTDYGRDMLYIGSAKGDPENRDYICSSKIMKKEWKVRPQDFSRDIVAQGTWKEMLLKEQELIVSTGAVRDLRYYNQSNSLGPYHADTTGSKHTQKTKDKISASWTPKRKARLLAAQKKYWTPERRAQQSVRQTGTPHSPKHTVKLAASWTPNRRTKHAASQSCDYQIGWPDGHEEIIRNLRAFSRAHDLGASNMVQVSKGRRKHHKGFRCRKIGAL